MEQKTKKIWLIVLIVGIIILVALALTLGLVFGLKKDKDKDQNIIDVLNSYDNTEELIKKYNLTVVPTLIFVDENGNVKLKTEGMISQEKLEQQLKALSDNE